MGRGGSGPTRSRLPARAVARKGGGAEELTRYLDAVASELSADERVLVILREAEILRQASYVSLLAERHGRPQADAVHPGTLARIFASAITRSWGGSDWAEHEPRPFRSYYLEAAVPQAESRALETARWGFGRFAAEDVRVEALTGLLELTIDEAPAGREARRLMTTLAGGLHALLLEIPEEHRPAEARPRGRPHRSTRRG